MALAFASDRVTSDVDFTATEGPDTFPTRLVDELNSRLPRAAIELGYLDVIAQVQSVRMKPRALDFAGHDFPAMRVRIGSARRGTEEEKRLSDGQASRVLNVDVSFKDQVYSYQELRLAEAGVAVRAFSLHELIAEKFGRSSSSPAATASAVRTSMTSPCSPNKARSATRISPRSMRSLSKNARRAA